MSDHCPSHAIFEKMIQQSLDNLGKTIAEGISCLTKQAAKQNEALQKVLENQADRRELCGKQCARLDALEESNEQQWSAITDLRKVVWMALGGAVLVQVVIVPIVVYIFTHFFMK